MTKLLNLVTLGSLGAILRSRFRRKARCSKELSDFWAESWASDPSARSLLWRSTDRTTMTTMSPTKFITVKAAAVCPARPAETPPCEDKYDHVHGGWSICKARKGEIMRQGKKVWWFWHSEQTGKQQYYFFMRWHFLDSKLMNFVTANLQMLLWTASIKKSSYNYAEDQMKY